MPLFDVIIVGSGAGGTFAAYQLRKKNVLMLDVGYTAPAHVSPTGELYQARGKQDLFEYLIGAEFESASNLHQAYLSPKLKAPLLRYITKTPNGESLEQQGTQFLMSFAQGGFACGWGGGAYEYQDRDLAAFPIRAADLKVAYEKITDRIGISGELDDLQYYYGSTANLQPGPQLNKLAASTLKRYQKHRDYFLKQNVRFGRGRIAILTRPLGNREAHGYNNWEFFVPNQPSLYNPSFTLKELINDGRVDYRSGYLVKRFKPGPASVLVTAVNLKTGKEEEFKARKCILAAGTLNTAKIVLASRADTTTKLPILDNATTFLPFVRLASIGQPLDTSGYPGGPQMFLYDGPLYPEPIHATFYSVVGPLRCDFLGDFPLSMKGNLTAVKYLLPALAVVQIFYPDDPASSNYLRLQENGCLEIRYRVAFERGRLERHLIAVLRKLGLFSHLSLCRFSVGGSGIHYAGSLPMKEHPSTPYETDCFCRLHGAENVVIADAATFPRLPTKNHTLTIMANAMRVADKVEEELS